MFHPSENIRSSILLKLSLILLSGKRLFLMSILVMATGNLLLFSACTKGNSTDSSSPVPNVTVNISINTNTSPYTGLKTVGGVIYLANVGYRGILVYRLNSSTIMAFDQTCT